MITTASPIIGKGGTVEEAMSYLDRPDAEDEAYVFQMHELCVNRQLDFRIAFAQFCWETDDATSSRWLRNRNPAGLAVVKDSDPDPAKFTGKEAAIVHAYALYHANNRGDALNPYLPNSARAFQQRWEAKYRDPNCPLIKTVADLSKHYVDKTGEPQATWMWDQHGPAGIAAKARTIFKQEEPMPITYGKVPYPAIVPSYLPASNPLVQEGGAPDVPDAIFWHRMVGSLLGTDGWFHGGHAATAYGVGVAARDGAALAGVIYEWIKPRTGWYGESSGPAVAPYGDGSKFINEVTVNGVNRRSKAIEISGDVNTPMDEKSRHAIAHMTAYWADQKKIPWDVFPIIPGSTRSYVIWHNEITGMAYKTCPGTVVMNETSALIERTRQVMKQYQTAGSPTPEPPPPPVVVPQKPTWFDHGLRTQTDQHDGDLLAQYVERIMKVSPKHKSQKRTSANRGAPVVEVLQPGAKVTSAFMARIDGLDWMWDQDGWAYQLNSFTPKIALPLKPRP